MFTNLRAFHHVVEAGSYYQAGKKTGRSVPNLIYHVKQLERKIGRTLIIDGKATEAGHEMYRQLYKTMAAYDEFKEWLDGSH